jgi:2-methylcitrate dehydratase PrpD
VGRPLDAAPTPGRARLCAGYVGARALLRGTVDLDDFRPAALGDPATHALARRFAVRADANPDPNALGPVTVELTVKGGRRHEIAVEHMWGSPAHPLSREAHLAKFHRNWMSGARPLDEDAGARLVRLIDDLEALTDVRELVDLACAGRPHTQ